VTTKKQKIETVIKNAKSKLDSGISWVESKLDSVAKVLVGIGVIWAIGLLYLLHGANEERKITDATVMITRLSRGGGTGVIISNKANQSIVLTNNHVCEAIETGGNVVTNSGLKYLITSYAKSQYHDLCLVYVQVNLGISAKIAKAAPQLYTPASISGHPNLLPTVVTKGHFSGIKQIDVFTGIKKCTPEMLEDASDDIKMLCGFFGGIPIVKKYDAMLVTAMIMAGSSGSAVYNSDNEISGLAFAGTDGLSYAYVVPYEYVSNFLDNEPKSIVKINYEIDVLAELQGEQRKTRKDYFDYISDKCEEATEQVIVKHCEIILNTQSYRKGLY
jgi:S1-C subfamily serine protease